MPAKTEVTEQDWGAPQQPHSGDVLGACPHPPPVLRCLWEVASSCRVGGGVLCFLPTTPTLPQPTSSSVTLSGTKQFGKQEEGTCQEREDAMGGCRTPSAPSLSGEPLWLAPPRGSSRSTLTFRQPWSSSAAPWLSWPAFLQMDGKDWLQGLSFQRPS